MNEFDTITKIDRNIYRFARDNKYIIIKVEHTFLENVDINILNLNMSDDNVIFIKQLRPCEFSYGEDDYLIIGTAYLYKDKKCISNSIVDLYIVDTNMKNAKEMMETYFI